MIIRNRREESVETGDEKDLMPEPRVVNHGEGAARWLSFETEAREPRGKRRCTMGRMASVARRKSVLRLSQIRMKTGLADAELSTYKDSASF